MLRALADPTRLRLVSMVAGCEDGEACGCDLTPPPGLTQPTISHNLKILVGAGIFTRDKRGAWACYALVPAALNALAAVLTWQARIRDRRARAADPWPCRPPMRRASNLARACRCVVLLGAGRMRD